MSSKEIPRREHLPEAGTKLRDAAKVELIPIRPAQEGYLPKPDWIRIRVSSNKEVARVKGMLRENRLVTVCEEANCPNLNECFGGGTATFMILGDVCTRRCPFCDVAHGKPKPVDAAEAGHLAQTVAAMGLNYVVITSVDRDDLRDGGAGHFADCVAAVRSAMSGIRVEILTPDFRGRMQAALEALAKAPPDVFNHNLETVERLTPLVRSRAQYQRSLHVLKRAKETAAEAGTKCATKSGLMLGLGETEPELFQAMDDLLEHGVTVLTLGQYLRPSEQHLPVVEYVHPDTFENYKQIARNKGFRHVASAPLVRSSYHAADFKPELDL